MIAEPDLSKQDIRFLTDLRITDPSVNMARIKRTKGGLLQAAYRWILDHDDFSQWRNDDQSQLL
ncbi:hypothetical protein LZ30DRAFT_786299 [Colletotrichum cereale]|nr:hypothetical protein LZ30DRAFT_786299 [Colletotrichum cereale]